MGDAVIPQDWDGETYKCFSVMWPNSFMWKAVLNGLFELAGSGWYWNEDTGSVIAARDAVRATWSYNFDNEEVLMSCNEDTLALFERMAEALEALANRECCSTAGTGIINSGSRGAGITPQIPNSYDEGAGPPETPPFGFDTWAQYRTHKCNQADDIVKWLKTDLYSLSNLDLSPGEGFSSLISGIITVLLTPVPYDDLALLVSLITVAAVELSFLSVLSSAIQDNAEDLRCTLYTASDAQNAMDNFLSDLDAIIDSLSIIESGKDWLKEVVRSLVTFDSINRLFKNVPTEAQDSDCSMCGSEEITVQIFQPNGQSGLWGSVEWDGTEITGSSEFGDGTNRCNFNITTNLGEGRCLEFTFINVSGASHVDTADWWRPCGGVEEECPNSNCEDLSLPECAHSFLLASNTPFTFTMTAVDPCTP